MSTRSASPSDEGEGDDLRPGVDRDSSEESSEEDPEEARRIAEGFIVDEEEEDDEEVDETPEERRRRKHEEKRKRKKEKQRRERERARSAGDLSEDELDLIQENRGRGFAGPSSNRPLKRGRERDEDGEDNERLPTLQDIFREDEERRALEDEDDDDLGDFIEEDEDDEGREGGETEEARRERKRAEKAKRREAARTRPELAGVDRTSWDEIYAVFGDGQDFDWALEGEEGMEVDEDGEAAKKDLRLEDVFDPAEIKARRLQDEDKIIAHKDIPERHQLLNSTLSDNPILAPVTPFPPAHIAAGWAYNKISFRTQYLFCNMQADNSYPEATLDNPSPFPYPRRSDLSLGYNNAVTAAINLMFHEGMEVPYLWHYKRDIFSVLEHQGRTSVQFLERDELWQLYTLGLKFRAIYERNLQISNLWGKIKEAKPEIEDRYLTETLLPSVCIQSIEAAAEGYEWLLLHYPIETKRIREDEMTETKRPDRLGPDSRSGPIMRLVKEFGIDVASIATAFTNAQGQPAPPVNSDSLPSDLAELYSGAGTGYILREDALKGAQQVLVTEFVKDPSLRQQARLFVESFGHVSVTPTDRGMTVIDEYHLYFTFKFLTNKPMGSFKDSPQFLHMLKAEEEGLITITINVLEPQIQLFAGPLVQCVKSNDYGEIATAWNELREEICQDVVRKHLLVMAGKWAKEHLRGEAEEFVAERCRMELEFRVNVRPYATPRMDQGETPSVLAITNGKGDIKDAVMAVMLDDEGNIRTQTKFDNLKDDNERESFIELIERRIPRVIVIGGMSVHTAKLREDVSGAIRQYALRRLGENPPVQEAYRSPDEFEAAQRMFEERVGALGIPLIFVNDATARIFMSSEEAERDHPSIPANGKYALALARYVQNPLNAYCKLGRAIGSVTFMEHHQKLIPQEKLLLHLERGLVNAVCFMGIWIASAVSDPYERAMLPFIAGLGPRKADALIKEIHKEGSPINRNAILSKAMVGMRIFENFAGFLSIDTDLSNLVLELEDPGEQPDPLDMTRIHPDDYEFAQKMCQDALDLDKEDVADQHLSAVVLQLLQDEDRGRKLRELNLDDFAFNLIQQGQQNKRHTLGEIVAELIAYRADTRAAFHVPNEWEVVQMLTGETERTIGVGCRVTATVRRAMTNRVFCQLESGMDAILETMYVDAPNGAEVLSCEGLFQPRQAIRAVIIESDPRRFQVKLSTRAPDLAQAVPFIQPFADEPFNDLLRKGAAEDAAAAKKRRKAGSVKRVVNHPNWHVLNSGQAEEFLASGQRGDVVIRPSSKGPDHLAVTWKVDEDVFQHIDVMEIDKPNEYSLGRILRVAGKYSYSDLDELIINHVKAMGRKFDEMQVHEKYRLEDELEAYLKNYVQAHPGRSMYGFSLDSDRPGYLKLCFLNKSTKDGGVIQTWPVKVLPGAYQLGSAEVPGVTELCNAFKAQYSSRLAEMGGGGKTPGIRAGRTPAGGRTPGGRTPGGRTPAPGMRGGATPMYGGRTPVRPPAMGMTPNPYGMPDQGYGGATQGGGYPGYGMPQGGYGGMTPGRASGAPGMGMSADRAAMLARQGGR